MAQSASERRAAQRRTARIVRQNRALRREQQTRIVDLNIRQAVFQARASYAADVMAGREPMPVPGSAESKNLAAMASYASRGQADPRFEAAFSRYWYHFKEAQTPADDEIEVEIIEDDDEDYDDE